MNIINKLTEFSFEIGAILLIVLIVLIVLIIQYNHKKRSGKVFSEDTEIYIDKLMRDRDKKK